MPKVSVIVPNYNHARFLPQRIESVLRQTYQDFELILLDDYSTDDSRAILSQYAGDPRVRIEFNEANSGSPFKQWNKGVRLARGEYVWIAESDDYADERLLERLASILETDAKIAFADCRSWRVTDDGHLDGFGDEYLLFLDPLLWATDFCMDGNTACTDYFTCMNPVPNASAVVFRKSVYESVGGADEGYRLCGDWKLWAAMALTGKIAHVGQPLNYFRIHEFSMRAETSRTGLDLPEKFSVIRWMLDRVTPTEPVLERLRWKMAALWVPALMSMRVSLEAKWAILRGARTIDPHALRRALRPAFDTVQRKILRHSRSLRLTSLVFSRAKNRVRSSFVKMRRPPNRVL